MERDTIVALTYSLNRLTIEALLSARGIGHTAQARNIGGKGRDRDPR